MNFTSNRVNGQERWSGRMIDCVVIMDLHSKMIDRICRYMYDRGFIDLTFILESIYRRSPTNHQSKGITSHLPIPIFQKARFFKREISHYQKLLARDPIPNFHNRKGSYSMSIGWGAESRSCKAVCAMLRTYPRSTTFLIIVEPRQVSNFYKDGGTGFLSVFIVDWICRVWLWVVTKKFMRPG